MQSQSFLGKVLTLSLIVSAVIYALSTTSIPATAAPRESYTWKKVRIDGEGCQCELHRDQFLVQRLPRQQLVCS